MLTAGVTLLSASIGLGLIVISSAALVLDVVVLMVLMSGGFLTSPSTNPVYILAFFNIMGGAIQEALVIGYLGPTSIIQRDFFKGGKNSLETRLLSWAFLSVWYLDMFFQPITATNRFIMVCFPRYSFIFTRKTTAIIAVTIFVMGFVLAFFSDFVISCCIAYIYYRVYSYTYIDTGPNYVNEFIDVPLNSFSSFSSIFIYIIIYFYIHRSNRLVGNTVGRMHAYNRRIKEFRCALQFAACSVFSLIVWVTYRLFPVVIPPDQLEWSSLMTIAMIFHNCANAFVFAIFNKEIKQQLRKYFGQKSESSCHTNPPRHLPSDPSNLPIAVREPSEIRSRYEDRSCVDAEVRS